jgi:hypothetical protein
MSPLEQHPEAGAKPRAKMMPIRCFLLVPAKEAWPELKIPLERHPAKEAKRMEKIPQVQLRAMAVTRRPMSPWSYY